MPDQPDIVGERLTLISRLAYGTFDPGERRIVGDSSWNLGDKPTNLARAQAFVKSDPRMVREFREATLLHAMGQTGGQIGIVSKCDGALEYFVQYKAAVIRPLGRCATEVKLWRSDAATVPGTSSLVLDDILLVAFEGVVSDTCPTYAALEFWIRRLHLYRDDKRVGLFFGMVPRLYDPRWPMRTWLVLEHDWARVNRLPARRFFVLAGCEFQAPQKCRRLINV